VIKPGQLTETGSTTLVRRLADAFGLRDEAIAVRQGDNETSYGDLWSHAGRWAGLLGARGVGNGDVVAVEDTRTLETIALILALWRIGAAPMPFGTDLPAKRLGQMLEVAQPVLAVVATETGRHLVADIAQVDLFAIELPSAETAPHADLSGDELAYLLFTSGSTGTPKAVAMPLRGLDPLMAWQASHGSRITCQYAPLYFDVAFQEILSTFLAGGELVLVDADTRQNFNQLAELVAAHGVERLFLPTAALDPFCQVATVATPDLHEVIVAGEQLHVTPAVRTFFTQNPQARLSNHYGPCETHVVTVHDLTGPPAKWPATPPIGRPLPHVRVRLAPQDADAAADIGELIIEGPCVADGYHRSPERTSERFGTTPDGVRSYRTGDLVRWSDGASEHGVLEFCGRADRQVKVRGFRVEVDEVEATLKQHPAIAGIAVLPHAVGGETALVAYVVDRSATAQASAEHPVVRRHVPAWIEFAAEKLPEYMIPSIWVELPELPATPTGKVDRLALPEPPLQRPPLAVDHRPPAGPVELKVAQVWDDILGFQGSGADDPFFEAGGSSLMATRLMARVSHELGVTAFVSRLFEAPTIAGLAQTLQAHHPDEVRAWAGGSHQPTPASSAARSSTRPVQRPARTTNHLAIVGMSARVPGAASVTAFWQNLLDGVDSLRILTPEELAAAGVPDVVSNRPDYVPVSGWIDHADAFDHGYFGYTPFEAERIDPQQRLLLELAVAAFDDAAIATAPGGLRAGIYAGVAANSYLTRNVLPHDQAHELGLDYTLLGNDKDYAATRIAYKLGFTGPALTVQTACSSSGVALHLACQALLNDDCDVALAGGAALPWQYQFGHEHVPGGALSADGRIRSFDAAAGGMVLTAGGACLVLRRLDEAIADGHTIHAVIRGTALSNDGAAKASFTAPGVPGQRSVIRAALDRAGVNARDIGTLEAHGTGTPVGDPIEVSAISQAWREDTPDVGYCAIGSVKSNIGHLDAGAAAIGAVKLALMVRHGERPASLHCDTPNPECQFEDTPFVVNRERTAWASAEPRLGALSSFGFGGTNFHAIFEEGPTPASTPARRPWQLLRLSAKNAAALSTQQAELADALTAETSNPLLLADVAHTLDVGRNRHGHRAAVVAGTVGQAAERLRTGQHVVTGSSPIANPHLVFTFPGQGAQHPGMGRRLYETEPVFRSAINQCADILLTEIGTDLRELLYPDGDTGAAAEALRNTHLAQPAIFSVSYATAKLWISWGLAPDAMIGHSVGELVAATLSGVVSLDHALLIIAERGRLMQTMPSGGMLAVRISEDDVLPYLGDDVSVAGVNSPQVTILSGPHHALDSVRAHLEADGFGTTPLHTSHAFHSAMMDPVLTQFAQTVSRYPLNAPTIPFYSSVTGLPITPEQAQDPEYWAQQLRCAVRFGPAIQHLVRTPGAVLLECGPGQNLTTSARQTLGDPAIDAQGGTAIASLPHAAVTDADDAEHLGTAVARLFVAGIELDTRRFTAGETRTRVSLPGHPFVRTRHWLEPGDAAIPLATSAARGPVAAANPAGQPDADLPAEPGSTLDAVRELFLDVAGVQLEPGDEHSTFLELGFDSLLLTQITSHLNARMGTSLRFRQLLEDFPTADTLAAHLDTLGATTVAAASPATQRADDASGQNDEPVAMTLRQGAKIKTTGGEELTERQREALNALIARYIARTGSSRAYADEHRKYLADPRAVTGFRPLWKDLVYPLVSAGSHGPRFTDIDGNEYVDLTNGYGSTFFGHRPDFVVDAVHRQIDNDIIIGPQSPIVGESARLFTEMTGHDRVTFCNTGSEAVLAAIRLARTVTGRNLIVQHEGDYHGINDEVLVRGTPSGRTIPAAPGVPPESVANTLMLEYGTEKSLEILRARAHELAAIVIEPVQSGNPSLQPADYVREVRRICDESGTALIMDEVICGFRVHWAGALGLWGVRADLACYGKIFGGGMPVGALAGSARFMDALDGGAWQYGDDSMPEVGVTYFAGTFVRHPLTMAVVLATLQHMQANPGLQEEVSRAAENLVDRLHALFKATGLPMHIGRFGSLMKPKWDQPLAFGELLYYFLREAGINAWDGRPNYLTTAHGEVEFDAIVDGFAYAIDQMKSGGFLDDVVPSAELFGIPAHSDEPITVPSTEAQREVWLAARFVGNNSVAYNEGLGLNLNGPLDEEALHSALQTLLDRHESLRAHFSRDGRSMIIQPTLELVLAVHDVSHLDETERAKALQQCSDEEMTETFDLRRGPLVRFRLVKLDAEQHQLLFVAHHAICDGWSGAVVLSELAALYSGHVEGTTVELAPAPRYADYSVIERHFLQSANGQAHQDYWLDQLREVPPPPQLPPDRCGADDDLSAARIDLALDGDLLGRLRAVGSAQGASLVATMLTGFAGLLQQRTGQDDLVIGLAAAGQSFHDQGQLVGHCVNLLPLRLRIGGADVFTDALQATRGALLDAFDHQGVSVGTLLENLNVPRSGDRPPLVSVVFNIDVRDDDIAHTGLQVSYETLVRQAETFELFINVVDNGSSMVLEASYRTALYSEELIREFLGGFVDLLRRVCADPSSSVAQLVAAP
jgi:amino acid adenylation domain-containing protein